MRGDPKTNNHTKGWHNRFHGIVGKPHPSLYALIKALKKEQDTTEKRIAELEEGKQIRQDQRREYRKAAEKLSTLTGRYEEFKEDGRILEYLQKCGNQFSL